MIRLLGSIVSMILFFLSGIHVYWAFGGRWGIEAAIPTTPTGEAVLNPGPTACLLVALALAGAGTFILHQAGILSFKLPGWLNDYGLYVLAAVFAMRAVGDLNYVGFFKKIGETQFGQMDTLYYSPLCLTLSVLMVALAKLR